MISVSREIYAEELDYLTDGKSDREAFWCDFGAKFTSFGVHWRELEIIDGSVHVVEGRYACTRGGIP